MLFQWYFLTFFHLISTQNYPKWIADLNLPSMLIDYHVASVSQHREKCSADPNCSIKNLDKKCFGFEENCNQNWTISKKLNLPKCQKNLNKKVQEIFFEQADFGYLKSRKIRHTICESDDLSGSHLECSDQMTHCKGRNIFFDFKNLNIKNSKRYRQDVIQKNQVGGKCTKGFHQNKITENLAMSGYLTSWSDELQHFQSLSEFEINSDFCDVIFEKPTIVMKLDAAVNMYHHFCDFINLYASLHLNQTFHEDVDIIWWDTHPGGFLDKFYGVTWKAFSKNSPVELATLDKKRVCFKDVLFPLLARQYDGLFYNTPLVDGCHGSAMIQTFSEFILHRLGIGKHEPSLQNIRIVILSRSTAFRKILNIRELLRAIGHLDNVTVKVVDYNERIPFLRQLNTTSQADIFIGMHGAGLTHLLFLPSWAAIFEIYNCGDELCYFDLARLKGIEYFTWPRQNLHLLETDQNMGEKKKHKKFLNYRINVEVFIEVVKKIIEHVRQNPTFIEARQKLRRTQRQEL